MKDYEYSKDCATCGLFLDATQDERKVIRDLAKFFLGFVSGCLIMYVFMSL